MMVRGVNKPDVPEAEQQTMDDTFNSNFNNTMYIGGIRHYVHGY